MNSHFFVFVGNFHSMSTITHTDKFWLKSVLHNSILSKKGLFTTTQTKNVSLRHADYRLAYTTCIKKI